MAGIVGIYASIGEHVPWITKREKYHEPVSESWVNREAILDLEQLFRSFFWAIFLVKFFWSNDD